ncbi:MAG: hypothetical protein ACJA1A_002743 [Saprospiraceae bacterium]|jgi:hypothetical protein|tara:strand:+ start:252 stop:446 length:195 start_codon:yes stop_codon:yes gene_type:complete
MNENQEDIDMNASGDPYDLSSIVKLENNHNLYQYITSGILCNDLLKEVDYKVLPLHGDVLQDAK